MQSSRKKKATQDSERDSNSLEGERIHAPSVKDAAFGIVLVIRLYIYRLLEVVRDHTPLDCSFADDVAVFQGIVHLMAVSNLEDVAE